MCVQGGGRGGGQLRLLAMGGPGAGRGPIGVHFGGPRGSDSSARGPWKRLLEAAKSQRRGESPNGLRPRLVAVLLLLRFGSKRTSKQTRSKADFCLR